MKTNNHYLKCEGLTVKYGKIEAIHSIDFFVEKGQSLALCGFNGAGKSSLLSAIIGIVPHGGNIFFNNENINKLSVQKRLKKGIALIPEGRRVFSTLSVEENLILGGYTKSVRESKIKIKEIYSVFEMLYNKKNQLAGYLSGGQQQILAIARALMCDGDLLLVDEPLMGLSPIISKNVMNILSDLKNQGKTLIYTCQDNKLSLSIADSILTLEMGKIIQR